MKKRNNRLSLTVYLVLAGLVYLISAVLIGVYLLRGDDPVVKLPGDDPMETSDVESSDENDSESWEPTVEGKIPGAESDTSTDETEPDPTPIPLVITGDEVLTEGTREEVKRLAAELEQILQKEAPDRLIEDENGTLTQGKGHVTFAYQDLNSGFGMSYGGDEVRYSASLIKAFYIYAVLQEIEAFEADRANDDDGSIRYSPETEKYNLDAIWEYDPETMFVEGSGEIQNHTGEPLRLTWLELMEYALKYSDNIAFEQLENRFGRDSFYDMAYRLGLQGTKYGFMRLTAEDCVRFLGELHGYLCTDSRYAGMMREAMRTSYHLELICRYFYQTTTAIHKYGWDVGAFHDMALIFGDRPLAIAILSDYESGGEVPTAYFGKIVELTKKIHETVADGLSDENDKEGGEIIEEILPGKAE